MNAQFDWWLLLVGLVVGAGLTWLVLSDIRRRDDDVAADERRHEARWIVETLAEEGTEAEPAGIEEVLRLHRMYLASIPTDEPAWGAGDPDWPVEDVDEGVGAEGREPEPDWARTTDSTKPPPTPHPDAPRA